MKNKTILFLMCIIYFIGCIPKEQKESVDRFYTSKGGWGEMRIPLIKPLYLFCHDGEDWSLQGLLGNDLYKENGCSVYAIKKLTKNNDLFIFRSIGWGVIIGSRKYPDAWFILDTEQKIIEGYTNYENLQNSLKINYGITDIDTLSWRTPRSYYNEFRKEKFLSWFPDTLRYTP